LKVSIRSFSFDRIPKLVL